MYENAIKALIRPPRDVYGSRELGPTEFAFRGRRFVRKDFVLKNPRGMVLQCSHWMPHDDDRVASRLPCVVCLHGNSSSRVSAKFNLDTVLNEGATLLALDFAGSGRSEGSWVTLGWWEKDDLASVIQHLRDDGRTSSIALWGRSMGAATALMHCPRDPLIDGMILDSPFADLEQLINEIVERFRSQMGLNVPSWILGTVVRMVQSSVWKRTKMDILQLKPVAAAPLAHVRVLITAGKDDDFVPPHHAKAVFDAYAGPSDLVLLAGQDHNSARPKWFQDRAGIFLKQSMHIPDEPRFALYSPFSISSAAEQLGHAWLRALREGASYSAPSGSAEGAAVAGAPAAAAAGRTGQDGAASDADGTVEAAREAAGSAVGGTAAEADEEADLLLALELSKASALQEQQRRAMQEAASSARLSALRAGLTGAAAPSAGATPERRPPGSASPSPHASGGLSPLVGGSSAVALGGAASTPRHPHHLTAMRREASEGAMATRASTPGALTVGGGQGSMRFDDSFRAGSFRHPGQLATADSLPGPADGVLPVVEEPSAEDGEEDPSTSDTGLSAAALGLATAGDAADEQLRRAVAESLATAAAATAADDDVEGKSDMA